MVREVEKEAALSQASLSSAGLLFTFGKTWRERTNKRKFSFHGYDSLRPTEVDEKGSGRHETETVPSTNAQKTGPLVVTFCVPSSTLAVLRGKRRAKRGAGGGGKNAKAG